MQNLKYIPVALILFIIAYLAVLSFITRHDPIPDGSKRQLAACPDKPNCVSSLDKRERNKIAAIAVEPGQAKADWEKLAQAISQSGGEIQYNDGHYLHAVFTSRLFRFKDDFEAVRQENKIDLRSASRAGTSDFGQNRKRVESIRQAFMQP